ncbi:uncharacterized protein [Parasteatoda tepidariorum]|uniref:uncharacterized protein n=1 Tax=Parasteatoda tepidariorum TaxID=114398 RepID=UPI001C721B62|nr:uncharacterized protein LOC107439486 [Parasteatoda tepidariorum]
MDILSETAVLFSSFYNPTNYSKLIWDNETKHIFKDELVQQKYPFFLLGWVFFGAFMTGFFIHIFYAFVIRRVFLDDNDWDSTDGHFNPAYVDDESRPPENDHPPDYDSVMSAASANEVTRNQRFVDFLRQLVPKKETVKEDTHSEESPPSYSSALANLQCEISSS